MKPGPRVVLCPTCGKGVEWTPATAWRPFCSERCQLIDLGAWASEKFRVPVIEENDTLEVHDVDATPPAATKGR